MIIKPGAELESIQVLDPVPLVQAEESPLGGEHFLVKIAHEIPRSVSQKLPTGHQDDPTPPSHI
jgi:hypothetical protein